MSAVKGKQRRQMGDRAAPRGRSYVLIRKNPETNEWHGYCENSFSMSYKKGRARNRYARSNRVSPTISFDYCWPFGAITGRTK